MALKKSSSNGEWYEGQWNDKNGRRDGFGYCLYEDGSLYEGYWQDGCKHGQGRFITPNGYYEGEFNNNSRSGRGDYYWLSGDYYQGEWQNNQKQGFGRFFI